MANTLKVLFQSNPAASTSTDAYTVPGATTATVSSVAVCNQTANPITFRISVAVAGAALATKQYLYFDLPVGGNQTFIATIGITLGAADVVRVYSNSASASFSGFGAEVT